MPRWMFWLAIWLFSPFAIAVVIAMTFGFSVYRSFEFFLKCVDEEASFFSRKLCDMVFEEQKY